MENQNVNQNVKRGRGRPRVLTDEERRKNKTTYMLNREWFCEICGNDKNYSLAGKHCHLKTKKHERNVNKINMMYQIDRITQRLNPKSFFNIVRRIHVLDHLNFDHT